MFYVESVNWTSERSKRVFGRGFGWGDNTVNLPSFMFSSVTQMNPATELRMRSSVVSLKVTASNRLAKSRWLGVTATSFVWKRTEYNWRLLGIMINYQEVNNQMSILVAAEDFVIFKLHNTSWHSFFISFSPKTFILFIFLWWPSSLYSSKCSLYGMCTTLKWPRTH